MKFSRPLFISLVVLILCVSCRTSANPASLCAAIVGGTVSERLLEVPRESEFLDYRTYPRVEHRDFDSVKTVFYPFAGGDILTPFKLFPNANLVIGVDQHPFWSKAQHRSIDRKTAARLVHGFDYYEALDALKYLGPVQAARVQYAGGQIDQIRELQAGRFFFPKSHGEMDFRLGDREVLRKYIHIHSSLGDLSWLLNSQLTSRLESLQFDVILIKSVMGAFRGGVVMHRALKNYIEALLLSNPRTLLIEGQDYSAIDDRSKGFEFTSTIGFEMVRPRLTEVVEAPEFGYGSQACVHTDFECLTLDQP